MQRRVYDALNVLTALNVIKKERNKIWFIPEEYHIYPTKFTRREGYRPLKLKKESSDSEPVFDFKVDPHIRQEGFSSPEKPSSRLLVPTQTSPIFISPLPQERGSQDANPLLEKIKI